MYEAISIFVQNAWAEQTTLQKNFLLLLYTIKLYYYNTIIF